MFILVDALRVILFVCLFKCCYNEPLNLLSTMFFVLFLPCDIFKSSLVKVAAANSSSAVTLKELYVAEEMKNNVCTCIYLKVRIESIETKKKNTREKWRQENNSWMMIIIVLINTIEHMQPSYIHAIWALKNGAIK